MMTGLSFLRGLVARRLRRTERGHPAIAAGWLEKKHLPDRAALRWGIAAMRGRLGLDCFPLCPEGGPILEFGSADPRLRPGPGDRIPALGP